MPKAPTEKQLAARKKFGEAARARAEAKKAANRLEDTVPSADNADIAELVARMQEMDQELKALKSDKAQGNIQVNPTGNLTGTFEKYITSPKQYPDPIERLANEVRLQRFAFEENFGLRFEIGVSAYTTIDNVRTREPKFLLTLVRKIYDDDSGELTNRRYDVCNMTFHEDPETALVVAQENGVEVESMGEKVFLDEMRYLRMRDWLLECFYPPKVEPKKSKKEMVIGNRLVEVYEISSENSESIPFSQLSKKL